MTEGGLPPIVGMILALYFNVTVTNNGPENVSPLSIKLELINNGNKTSIDKDLIYYESNNFTLNSGETSVRRVDLLVDLDTEQRIVNSHQNFVATIISNEIVLDERDLY
jgi:hypothetical protein